MLKVGENNMDNLNTLIEKISTLNINTNTNIDIQSIVEKYVLYTQIGEVLKTLIIAGVFLIIAILIYTAYLKACKISKLSESIDEHIKELKNLDKYEIRNLLKEIVEYMPRIKRKRKTDY